AAQYDPRRFIERSLVGSDLPASLFLLAQCSLAGIPELIRLIVSEFLCQPRSVPQSPRDRSRRSLSASGGPDPSTRSCARLVVGVHLREDRRQTRASSSAARVPRRDSRRRRRRG